MVEILRHVKVRAYFNGPDTAGTAEACRYREPFPMRCAGDRFDGIEAVHHASDQNYVRFDMPYTYESADAAHAAASNLLARITDQYAVVAVAEGER